MALSRQEEPLRGGESKSYVDAEYAVASKSSQPQGFLERTIRPGPFQGSDSFHACQN